MITFSELAGSIIDRLRKYEDPGTGINEKGFGIISEKQYKFLIKLAQNEENVKIFPEEGNIFKKCEGFAQVGKKKVLPFAVYVHKSSQGERYAIYTDAYAEWPYGQDPPILFQPDFFPSEHDVIEATPHAIDIEMKASEYLAKLAEDRSKNYWFRPSGLAPLQTVEHDTLVRLWIKNPGTCMPSLAHLDGMPCLTVLQAKVAGCSKKTDITMVYLFRNDGFAFPFIHSSAHERYR